MEGTQSGWPSPHLGGKDNGAIIAYDLNTGDPKWQWTQEGPEYASPSLLTTEGTKQIVTLTEKSIVGIGIADGKILWQLPFVPERRAYNAATPNLSSLSQTTRNTHNWHESRMKSLCLCGRLINSNEKTITCPKYHGDNPVETHQVRKFIFPGCSRGLE